MSQRRIIILVAAIAIGAVASFLVFNYVGGIQSKADRDAQQVSVFLVKSPIARGTTGKTAKDTGAISISKMPRKFLPGNALTNLDGISKQVSVSALVPNQVVVGEMFVDESAGAVSFADRLTKIKNADQVTITISVDKMRGVAGLLKPGDFVNIMSAPLSTNAQPVATPVAPGAPAPPTTLGDRLTVDARMVLQKVEILAIAQTPVAQPGEGPAPAAPGATTTTTAPAAAADAGLLTLIVPADAAQYIASIPAADIYLSLVSKDYKPVAVPPLDHKAPLPGEQPSKLTPYGPDGVSKLG